MVELGGKEHEQNAEGAKEEGASFDLGGGESCKSHPERQDI